jgi:hypothetical protein
MNKRIKRKILKKRLLESIQDGTMTAEYTDRNKHIRVKACKEMMEEIIKKNIDRLLEPKKYEVDLTKIF